MIRVRRKREVRRSPRDDDEREQRGDDGAHGSRGCQVRSGYRVRGMSHPRAAADGAQNLLAAAIAGRTEITTIPGAGHLAELDKPDEVAAAILRWTA